MVVGCSRPGTLEVEGHLAVGLGSTTGRLRPAFDSHRRDFRGLQMETLEVAIEIGHAIAAAELDDGDALAGAVEVRREAVEFPDIGRVAGVWRRGRCGRRCLPLARRLGLGIVAIEAADMRLCDTTTAHPAHSA